MSLKEFFESDDLRIRIETAGYSSLKELQNKSIIQLAQDIELTEEEVSIVGSVLRKGTETMKLGVSAAKLVKEQNHGIPTNCHRLDQLFTPIHGIPRYGITEISGGPGSGKTQLCIQLSLNVQQSMDQGGVDSGCIYIDTEGGLMKERFYQIAQIDKDSEVARRKIQNIHTFRVLDHLEMIALVRQLPDVLEEYQNIKLIVIDSISYHLRLNIRNRRTRIGILNFIGQSLIRIADRFNVPIVVTNQAAPDMVFGTLRPALGDSWSQWCGNRLLLTRKRHERYATMYSAPQQTSKPMAPFAITQSGISDVDEETWARMKQWQEFEAKMMKESPETMNQWLASDLDTEHYHLEDDLSPWPTTCDENESWKNQIKLADNHMTDIPLQKTPDDDDQDEEDYVLAPDSQPEHTYVDLSVYFGPQSLGDLMSTHSSTQRRQSSPTQVSATKRQRLLGTSGNNDSFEIVCDSQDDTDWM